MQPVDILARSSQPVLREDLFLHNEGEVSATTMQIRASRDVEIPASDPVFCLVMNELCTYIHVYWQCFIFHESAGKLVLQPLSSAFGSDQQQFR